MGARAISFLSDYGYEDEFAGVCRAVIARIAPDAPLIEISHGVPPGDVRRGAAMLADALPYAPPGVHLAVVDPGVGTDRRPVAVRALADDRVLVGPDNGLLWPAVEILGGVAEAVDLGGSRFRLEPLSATFHGRDLFAPVAARLASGAALAAAGGPIELESLVRLELPGATAEGNRVVAEVLYVDRFGNATLSARSRDLELPPLRPGERLAVERRGGSHDATFAIAFGEVGEGSLLLYEDSSRRLALAVNRGSAAQELGLDAGDAVALRRHSQAGELAT